MTSKLSWCVNLKFLTFKSFYICTHKLFLSEWENIFKVIRYVDNIDSLVMGYNFEWLNQNRFGFLSYFLSLLTFDLHFLMNWIILLYFFGELKLIKLQFIVTTAWYYQSIFQYWSNTDTKLISMFTKQKVFIRVFSSYELFL